MKVTNKNLTAVIAAFLTCGISAAAPSTYSKSPSPTMGFSLGYNEPAGDDMVIGVDYMTSEMEAGFNFSAEHNLAVKTGKSDWNQASTGLYIGAVSPLKGNMSFSYGIEGNYTWVSSKTDFEEGDAIDHNPYVVGPYIGLAYKPNAHVKLFTRIMPISYETFGFDAGSANANANGKQNEWEFFNEGSMGIAYFYG